MFLPYTQEVLDAVPWEDGLRRRVSDAINRESEKGFLEGAQYKEQQILKAARPWIIYQKVMCVIFWAFFIALFCFWIQHR
jgi:G:T-mismatch repair DNA endonuclease (very short patch repair protein)